MNLLARIVCGFAIALVCTPAGVSGAFLLLPAQLYLFGAPSPEVSATNLVYNAVATPAGAATFRRHGRLDVRLAARLIAGTTPGVVIGALLRSTWLASASNFAWIAALVLLGVGVRLILTGEPSGDGRDVRVPSWRLALVGLVGGIVGGVYGFGGAALIVPWLVSVERMPVVRVAGAGLLTTFVTSLVGLGAFAAADWLGIGEARAPAWLAGLAFGAGGAVGAIVGARLQPRVPVRLLRIGLGIVAIAAGARTVL